MTPDGPGPGLSKTELRRGGRSLTRGTGRSDGTTEAEAAFLFEPDQESIGPMLRLKSAMDPTISSPKNPSFHEGSKGDSPP